MTTRATRSLIAVAVGLLACCVGPVPSFGQPAGAACASSPGYQRLDFWVGDWDVLGPDGGQVGQNRIEKSLGGCAVFENWTDVTGREGKSLFFYSPVTDEWKQVWVTDGGGLKEKTLVDEFEGPGVRFQGAIPLSDGASLLDRTTLTPLEDGRVRQVIEQSRDGGVSWNVGFDATYVPRAAADASACTTEGHRQFDFWLGDWVVHTEDGRLAGTNRIERTLGGCVLRETWAGATGSRGQSFNIYSPTPGAWHQTWVDVGGLLLQLDGGVVDGRMVLSGRVTGADGQVTRQEISWQPLPDGRVRQHWRSSTDDGGTWTDVFVGLYTRR